MRAIAALVFVAAGSISLSALADAGVGTRWFVLYKTPAGEQKVELSAASATQLPVPGTKWACSAGPIKPAERGQLASLRCERGREDIVAQTMLSCPDDGEDDKAPLYVSAKGEPGYALMLACFPRRAR